MKRILTAEEVQDLIKQEDQCGVNTCLQELLCMKNPRVIGEFNKKGELEDYEVKELENTGE